MSRKARDSGGQVSVPIVTSETATEQSGEGQLMVAMQPGAVDVSVEVPALGVEEVVIVTENTDSTSDVDSQLQGDQVATVGAVEEVKDEPYAELSLPTKLERSDNREVAEFLAATGSGRPIGGSSGILPTPRPSHYSLPRKQIKLEASSGVDTDSDSAEETSESEDDYPRKTPKKRDFAHRLQWRSRDMVDAMKAVEEKKMSIRGAAKKFGVPYSTLKDRVHGRVRHGTKPGVKTVLSPEEEEELVRYIRDMESAGFQMKHIDVRDRAGELLRLNHGHNSPYKDCSPGHNWLSGFMKRHPGLEFRRTCHRLSVPSLTKQKQMLRRFYDLASHVFKKNKLFNRPEKVYVVSEIRIGQYSEITVLVAASADGKVLPPFVIFRGQRVKQMAAARQEFPEAFFTCTFDGTVNEDVFLWWFRDHFIKKIPHSGHRPCALFLSRNISDITIQLVQLAKEEKVHLLGIPLGVAHLLQPFDEELSKHIAGMVERRIKKYEEENNVHMVPHKGISHILQKVWKKAISAEEVGRKFAANGLFPLDMSAISNERIITGAAQLKEYQAKLAAPSVQPSGGLSGLNLLSALSSHEYASLEHLYGSQENLNQSFDQESTTSDKTPSEYSTPKSKVVVSMLEEEAQQVEVNDEENEVVAKLAEIKTEKVTEQESLLMKTLMKQQEELKQQAKAKQRQSSQSVNLLERKTDIRGIAAARSNTEQINRAIDSILEKDGKEPQASAPSTSTAQPRVVTVDSKYRGRAAAAPKAQSPKKGVKIYKVSLVRKEPEAAKQSKPSTSYIQAPARGRPITIAPIEEKVEEEIVEELVEEMVIEEEGTHMSSDVITVKMPPEVAVQQSQQLYAQQGEVPHQEIQLIQKVQAQLPEEILEGENHDEYVQLQNIKTENVSAEQLGIHVNVDQSGYVQLEQAVAEEVVSGVETVEYVTESGDIIQQPIYVEDSGHGSGNWQHVVQYVQQMDNGTVVTEEVDGQFVQYVDIPVSVDGTVPEVVIEEQVE